MDIIYETVADALGADKTKVTNQIAIFYGILWIGGTLFYLSIATMSFLYFFIIRGKTFFPPTIDRKEIWKQVAHEIWIAVCSFPFMSVLMLPPPLFAYRGYSKIYKNIDDYGWPYAILSVAMFLVFTDCVIYWFHRGLHHPTIYKYVHKLHHVYKFTTPFSSHAFHPLDGFTQGIPYYTFAYFVPIHNVVFFLIFSTVNIWTISIHDQVDLGGSVALSTGHHTIHHEKFNYNYGQYTTLWDRLGGTYKPAQQTHKASQIFLPSEPKAAPVVPTPGSRAESKVR